MDSPTLLSLLTRWGEAFAQGQDLPAEHFCPEQPALALILQQAIDRVRPLLDSPPFAPWTPKSPSLPEPITPRQDGQRGAASPRVAPLLSGDLSPAPRGYELLGVLGRGGMGVVYCARQVGFDRLVALKMIKSGELADADELARFYKEAEALARINHPNIVQVFEIGEHRGQPFFSMEFCTGGSLEKRLAGTPADPATAARLVECLARAVGAAHQENIIHRDLKPANILLAEVSGEDPSPLVWKAQPKVSDFGMAKKLDDLGRTHTGAVVGTPSYMAPEQAVAMKSVGPPADIYSLGAILYECLTGHPPFKAPTSQATLHLVVSEEPVPVRRLQPQTPLDLETICHKCLHKDPARRYASAGHLAEDLGRYLRGEPILARPVSRIERTWRWCRRHAAVAGLLAAIFLVLIGTAVVSTRLAVWALEEKKKAVDQGRHADEQRQRAELALYSAQLERARHLWNDGNVLAAREMLLRCPLRHRGWEHRFLNTLFDHLGQITLPAQDSEVTCVAFSPHGNRLAAGSEDGHVHLWNSRTGKLLHSWQAHQECVRGLVFTPDGAHLVSCSDDRSALVWDLPSSRVCFRLEGHQEAIRGVACSPDGKVLATAGRDGLVKLWNGQTGQELPPLPGSSDSYLAIAFGPDGRSLATGGEEGAVRVWDLSTRQERLTLQGHKGQVLAVAWSPEGTWIASAGLDGTVQLWDTQKKRDPLILRGHSDPVTCLAFSPDGSRLASAGEDRILKVWEIHKGQVLFNLRGHRQRINSVAFHPDGTRLASAGDDREVRLWDGQVGQEVRTCQGHAGIVQGVACSCDGKHIASSSEDGTIRIWDTRTGRLQHTLADRPLQEGAQAAFGVAFCPDGSHLVAAGDDSAVRIWELASGRPPRLLRGHTDSVRSVVCSLDGRWIASGSLDRNVLLWDPVTGKRQTLRHHQAPVQALAFSSDSRLLASGSDDRTVIVWDVLQARPRLTLQGHDGSVVGVAFRPHRQQLASAGLDQTVRLWDATTGKELLALLGHSAPVLSIAFSPDGSRLASVSADGTMKIWDPEKGQELLSLQGHARSVSCVCFSPDGRRLITGSWDRQIKVWEAPDRDGPEVAAFRLDLVSWHDTQAFAARTAANWLGAAFHLERLHRLRPLDREVHRRLRLALSQCQASPGRQVILRRLDTFKLARQAAEMICPPGPGFRSLAGIHAISCD